jgi:tryptophanyl-tRNA synthetase
VVAADPDAVLEVLARGNARANELADATLDRVRSAMRMV